MKIDTVSGLHGHLIEFAAISPGNVPDQEALDGYAIVLRTDAPHARWPYSTHALYTGPEGQQVAEAGHYDLTLSQAREDLQRRLGRV